MPVRSSLALGRRHQRAGSLVKEARVISIADARRRLNAGPMPCPAEGFRNGGAACEVAPTKVLTFPASRRGQGHTDGAVAQRMILLVDDSASSLLWQRMILKNEPYTLVTASSAEQAIVLAASQRPDLVIMDVEMPGAGGLSGCRSLRDARATRDVPIVLLAVRSEMARAQWVMERGLCDAALPKPIERDALLREVRSRLS